MEGFRSKRGFQMQFNPTLFSYRQDTPEALHNLRFLTGRRHSGLIDKWEHNAPDAELMTLAQEPFQSL
jgi:hypothetical protein